MLSVTPPAGVPAPPPGEDFCDSPGYTCNRRFDRNRKDMFRYALFAHAIGLPKAEDPSNPDFHVPRTNTGVGDFPGGDVMVTLGAFADAAGRPVGTPFMQASTLMHELGHDFERRHGGDALEPNCKPTYLSVMNYLYQLRGLLDDAGRPHLDYSGMIEPTLDETLLADGAPGPLPYRIGWYAPLAGSYLERFGRAAGTHCDGSPLLATDVPTARIDNRTAATPIDWKANGVLETSAFSLDVNFNGRTSKLDGTADVLAGSNDWAQLVLTQTGARRSPGALFVADSTGHLAVGPLSLDSGRGDLGRGDLGRGDLGRGDLGRGDLGRGDLGRGDLGRGDLGRGDLGAPALGRGDLGRGDLGGGDLFVGDPNNRGGELDFETASGLARYPTQRVPRLCDRHRLHDPGFATTSGQGRLDDAEYRRCFAFRRVPRPGYGARSRPAMDADRRAECTAGPGGLFARRSRHSGERYGLHVFRRGRVRDGVRSDPSNLVTVVGVNDAPTIVAIPDQTIALNSSAGPLSVTVGDEDPASVTLTGTSSNTALVPPTNIVFSGSGSNRTVTVTPALNKTGTATITVTAVDGAGMTARDTFTVTVPERPRTYTFIGYLAPLTTAGTDTQPSMSGTFNFGRTIPLKWQLKQGTAFVSDFDDAAHARSGPGDCFTNQQHMPAERRRSDQPARPRVRSADRQQHLPVRPDCQAVHLQLEHERRHEDQLLSFEDRTGRWQCGEGHRSCSSSSR